MPCESSLNGPDVVLDCSDACFVLEQGGTGRYFRGCGGAGCAVVSGVGVGGGKMSVSEAPGAFAVGCPGCWGPAWARMHLRRVCEGTPLSCPLLVWDGVGLGAGRGLEAFAK